MRTRDAGLLFIAIIGIIVGIQSEGSVAFIRSFSISIYDEASRIRQLPKPIVTDLNGDGKNEVIAMSTSTTISVYTTHRARKLTEFVELHSSYSQPLTANCIGLATGYTTPVNDDAEKERKQIIVAVTDDYMVTAFDSTLTTIWSGSLPDQEGSLFVPLHATIMITSHAIHRMDQGIVVIGIDTKKHAEEDPEDMLLHEPTGVHFSYYGLHAEDGAVRWKHDASAFHHFDQNLKRPLQNYKLTAQHLEHHSGETDWRVFRRSVMAALPHQHNHPHDVSMSLHHFAKKLAKRKTDKDKAKAHKPIEHKTSDRKKTKDSHGAVGDHIAAMTGIVTDHITHAHSEADHVHHPNVVAVHLPTGIEIIHLYTGKTLTQVGPLQPNVLYDDVDGDANIDAVKVVIHSNRAGGLHGAFSRKEVCKGSIETGESGLYHQPIWNGSICIHGGFMKQFEVLEYLMREGETKLDEDENMDPEGLNFYNWGDNNHWTEQTRAAPPLTIHRKVHESHGQHKMHTNVLFFISSGLVTSVDAAKKRVLWQVETDATFVGHHENAMEEENIEDLNTISLRGSSPHDKLARKVHHFPHLMPFSIATEHGAVAHDKEVKHIRNVKSIKDRPFILVIGDNELVIIRTDTGKIETTVPLPDSVIAPVVIGDMNSDGHNDVLLITRKGYFGFIAHQHGGTSVLTFLMMAVLGMLGLLFVSQRIVAFNDPYYEPSRSGGGKRSTD